MPSDPVSHTAYLALAAGQKAAFNATINALCTADLTPIKPGIKPGSKMLLIAAYKLGVKALAGEGWLTKTQASQLSGMAASL